MEPRSFPEAETEFDEIVAQSARALDADTVCSTSRWIVPAAAAFASQSQHRVFRGEHGMVALLEHENPNGPVLTSFDSVWGFATPLVGPEPDPLVNEVFDGLLPTLDHYAFAVSGVVPASPLDDALQARGPVGVAGATERCVANLSDGFDSWLDRRSSRFRRSLRAAANRGEAAGISIESLAPANAETATAAFERILSVEATSWKTDAASGMAGTDLGRFTSDMTKRFAVAGDLRVLFARLDGQDIGYVIGGLVAPNDSEAAAGVGPRYRGFQHSFDQAHTALSIGKLLQFHNIAALCDEGVASYDMGMHMPYKESYTDRIEPSVSLIFANR